MRPRNSNPRWFAAAICVLATSGFVAAEEGVVCISATNGNAGFVRMNASAVQHAALDGPTAFSGHPNEDASPVLHVFGGSGQQTQDGASARFASVRRNGNAMWTQNGGANVSPIQFAGFSSAQCGPSGCTPQVACCAPSQCCKQGCNGCNGNGCNGNGCDGNGCYGNGYRRRMTRLFAGAVPQDSCNSQSWAKRWWRGQYANYHGRNQRLANHLFGWMVPSGCCGQGCPPVGKYQVTYADNPGYADHRDNGQAYGVQGYGVPLSVPLAPTVRQAYNYSWGTPSSRITPMGNYTPQTSLRPLYHQTW
ncbi:MAG: hypothetical protein P8J37_00255 [Fuerstiella sp.]|nr:hypothetical protein [Fuerstiella sp.]